MKASDTSEQAARFTTRWHGCRPVGEVPRLAAMAVTVLLVDDHDGFRSTARALLEGDGYEVIGDTADGFSALDAARRLRPDVVLLDVQLPDIDGFEVTRRLQRGGDTPAVVLISSRD